jgi:hypothetical protein
VVLAVGPVAGQSTPVPQTGHTKGWSLPAGSALALGCHWWPLGQVKNWGMGRPKRTGGETRRDCRTHAAGVKSRQASSLLAAALNLLARQRKRPSGPSRGTMLPATPGGDQAIAWCITGLTPRPSLTVGRACPVSCFPTTHPILSHVVPSSDGTDLSVLIILAEELDTLVRDGDDAAARPRADATILREGMGLSASDCKLLQTAADLLRRRRYSRSARS